MKMERPLEVFADLHLDVEGEDISIQSNGDHIVMDLDSLRAGRRLLAAEPLSGDPGLVAIRRIGEGLRGAGLTLEVRLDGDSFVWIGKNTQPGRIGQFLNLRHLEIRPARPLWGTMRRHPIITVLLFGGLAAVLGWVVLRDR
mgnify:CR=1 FL=1